MNKTYKKLVFYEFDVDNLTLLVSSVYRYHRVKHADIYSVSTGKMLFVDTLVNRGRWERSEGGDDKITDFLNKNSHPEIMD